MNGKTVRSRSNSPSSSVDSIYRKKLNKKPIKSQKSREDVQVFTSLPPKVEGEIKCYLKLQISRINLVNEPAKTNQPVANNARQNRNIKSNLKDKNPPSDTKNGNLIARCIWWGEEDTTGAVFRPKVFGTNCLDNKISQTLARYMVRSGPKQFAAYLNDMKTLDIDIIDDQSKKIIAKVQIMQISELTPSNSIKGYFPAFDSSQIKIADVYVSIQFESVHKNLVDKKRPSDQSENSRPVTPTPASNINDFNTKYDQFEKKQLDLAKNTEENKSKDILKKLPNSLLFNSNCYVNTLNEDMMEKSKNPIIQNLIERGLKLKREMSQSAISIEPKGLDLKPVQSDAATFYSIISNKTDLFDDYLEEDNDVSRLSDPLNDHQILSNILYSQESPSKSLLTEDQELKNLLEPPDLFTRLIKNGEPKIDHTVSRCSIFSHDQTDDENCRHNPSVSFEVQSSDGEGSICNDRYIDILSPQRISLLNLIQISKISIDKLIFFNSSMIQNVFDQLNRTREPSPSHQLATKSSNSKSKPPLAGKKFDMASMFFIEYQFPVMGNIMEESTNPMSSQVMRVVSKKIDKKESTNECSVIFDHQADYSVLFNSHSLDSWWRSHASFKIYIRPFANQSNVKTIAISNASSGPQLI
ncbi:C2 domain-containing 3, partial [Brachionus plicatilis]